MMKDEKPPWIEINMQAGMSRMWKDEIFHDLQLQAGDGTLVGCSRIWLAARSQVFQTMLLGPFKERNSNVVDVAYPGPVVQALVEYLCTGSAELFVFDLLTKKRKRTRTEEEISIMISLADAAAYYELYDFQHMAEENVFLLIQENKVDAIQVLEFGFRQGPTVPPNILTTAMNAIQTSEMAQTFHAGNVANLSCSTMEYILKNEDMQWTEYQLFHLLHCWTEHDEKERTPLARQMSNHIRLDTIAPITVEMFVTRSGLISQDRLLHAYKTHALENTNCEAVTVGKVGKREKPGHECLVARCKKDAFALQAIEPGKKFNAPRHKPPSWKISGDTEFKNHYLNDSEREHVRVFDVFDITEPLSSGVHEWTVEVQSTGNDGGGFIALGIQYAGLELLPGFGEAIYFEKDLGSFCGSCSYHGQGYTMASGKKATACPSLPRIRTSNTITFKLDLRPHYQGQGSLKVFLNGRFETVAKKLYSDILLFYTTGYLPAASIPSGASLRIISMKVLED